MDCDIASYHIDSFNYLAEEGVQLAAQSVPKEKFRLPSGEAVELSYTGASISMPTFETGSSKLFAHTQHRLLPAECRQRGLTYAGNMKVGIEIRINGHRSDIFETVIGRVPIMLRSILCHLSKMNRKELTKAGEEWQEKGGYFICQGSEKVIRLLVSNRRNFPIALCRNTFREKGSLFTEYGVMMRCVKDNHTAVMMTLHYLESGTISIALQFRREIFYIPFMYILKALVDKNDLLIATELKRGRMQDEFFSSCVMNMLSLSQEEGILHRDAALRAVGSRFRVAVADRIAPWEDDEEAGRFIINSCVAVHLDDWLEKFYTLVYMAQKLFALVKGECAPETPDNPQFQEAAVSGHIILLIIRERLENILGIVRRKLEFFAKRKKDSFVLTSNEVARALSRHEGGEISRGLEYFLATGNLVTRIGLALQQETGFSVTAERINQLRFVSHFRAIHRGAFFTEMRTTDVRKLRPEAWGFICPVHTPDGSPCGLLNHLTASCRIVTHYSDTRELPSYLTDLGMISHKSIFLVSANEQYYSVLLDGRFLGYIPIRKAANIERQLRCSKVDAEDSRVPCLAEIVLIHRSPDISNIQTQYPGLYILSDPARLIRPVRNLISDSVEFIGTFEQIYLSVVIDSLEAEPGVTIHQELHPSCLFSFAGNLIPFPDHNQSPRNVYQCQMGKQTMGVPVHSWHTRADNKMYRLQFPQNPLVKLEAYDRYGYDMEDAMVINKASFQRGFAHGTVIKVERLNLVTNNEKKTLFRMDPSNPYKTVTCDGLPIPGRRYFEGEVYYVTYNQETGMHQAHRFHHAEPAYCGIVRLVHSDGGMEEGARHALIQWRIERNPIIGDKFASRHGQKGINSFLWPVENLPFSETGMVPDIIFNPHGFPSRMTIDKFLFFVDYLLPYRSSPANMKYLCEVLGMMIESMAGKAAAMHGEVYDASPFVFNEKHTAIDYFGELLSRAGYNYHGNETFYSGVDGREFEVQIFFGVVYYQRLRHMIADKFQVRSTGPIDPITHQPVKGRKKGGGIRFGEMERDAIIAHGTAFVLQVCSPVLLVLIGNSEFMVQIKIKDRLLNCSDRDMAYACRRCASLLSVSMSVKASATQARKGTACINDSTERPICRNCGKEDEVYLVQVPRVLRYLTAELAAMNIKVHLELNDLSKIIRM
ncbi:DNA-directed RNA polymerase, beta subunit [Dictyocaulus viviparus]|uniref:DNA-directed RNA polymerase n=1 Tax=Dictyocaulus viviparus TaxID=29172 RepID=A0A0D8XWT5_DICVI|nr:DNA-directed RNA polymerase, beta subunit [Dictyocaulus viviparus]